MLAGSKQRTENKFWCLIAVVVSCPAGPDVNLDSTKDSAAGNRFCCLTVVLVSCLAGLQVKPCGFGYRPLPKHDVTADVRRIKK
jgi:hypothetical protein